jgi:hypothetical protein
MLWWGGPGVPIAFSNFCGGEEKGPDEVDPIPKPRKKKCAKTTPRRPKK